MRTRVIARLEQPPRVEANRGRALRQVDGQPVQSTMHVPRFGAY
jgi:hypothetical protein